MINEKILESLRIVGWGLIVVALIFAVLMYSGLIHSPSELLINNLITGGILAIVIETRVKFELVWSEFKKRKEI